MSMGDQFLLRKMDFLTTSIGVKFAGGMVVVGIFTFFFKHRGKSDQSTEPNIYPKDVVILHQTDRGPYAPSISPFVVKLETYLRMSKLPYKNVLDNRRGPKGKLPWIEYNGEIIADTQFIMEYLNNLRGVNLNKNLTLEQNTVAHLLQRIADEHLYWIMIQYRWVIDKERTVMKLTNWSKFKIWFVGVIASLQTYFQGVGRHSPKEVLSIFDQDLKTLSDYLGDKKYFMGDEPSQVDCSIFGQLSQFRWHLPNTDAQQLIIGKYPNLNSYLERLKSTYWPDWNECITCETRNGN